MPVDRTVFLSVASLRREALAQSATAAPQPAFEAKTSWRSRNELVEAVSGLEAVKEDPEEGSDESVEDLRATVTPAADGRTFSSPLPAAVRSSGTASAPQDTAPDAEQQPRAAESCSWRQKLMARLGTSHTHHHRHYNSEGSTAEATGSNSVSADHVLLKPTSKSSLVPEDHQYGATIAGCSPRAADANAHARHHRHHHRHQHHLYRQDCQPPPRQQHQQPHSQHQHRQNMPQQHRLTAAPNVARSPVPTATRATAGPMHGPGPGPASPRGGGGCHLVPLLSAGDVQLAMQALQSAAWIQDYVWNSADPATAASPRTTSGGGGGISSRREALAAVAAPVYREALAAASQIQHPALHSLVNQAVAYYVDPALGEPEDVLRVILELLTACGGTPAATAAPQPPLQQLHPPAARDARVPSNSSAVRHKQAQPASANSAAAAGSRRSESGTSRLSVVTAPQHRSMDDTRRTSSSCRASPVAAESAASRGCGALGSGASGLSKHGGVSGTRVAGVEASLPAGAEARGSGSGSGFKGFGLRQVAQRFLFRSDGSSTSGTGSATSEAALSVGSSLGSLGLCTNGSAATAGVDAAARLSSTGSGVAAPHSGGEGVPSAGPNSNGLLAGPDAAMQAYLVMTDASYTASAPTSLTTAGATSPAAVTAAAMFALGGSAGAEGSGSGRRAAALLQEGLERVPVPRGGSGSGDATGVSSGASRALRALSLHGLRDLVFRSHHSSPARGTAGQRSSTGGGMDSSTRLEAGAAVPPHALVVLDGGGGTAPEDTRCRQQQQQQQQHRHHRHHLKGLLGLFKKAATATH